MQAPVKPRYVEVGVQLQNLENEIFQSIPFTADLNWWFEMDEPDPEYLEEVDTNIKNAFQKLVHVYSGSSEVIGILNTSLILIQNCAWTALNTPIVGELWDFEILITSLKRNLLRVFDRNIYEPLKKAMMMANHHTEVIQRVWRRCDTNPVHPMCRRRLLRDFDECIKYTNERLRA